MDNMPPLPYLIIIPLASAFLIPIVAKRMKAAGGLLSCAVSFALVAVSFYCAKCAIASKVLVCRVGLWMPPAGISLVVDGLSVFMLVTVNLMAFLITVYSVDYMKRYTDTWKFYSLFMVLLAGINGVLIAGDIFNLYVFMEIAALAAYFLVAFGTEAQELEASFKYAVMGTVASTFILLGIAFLYSYTSTLNLADISAALATRPPAKALQFVSVLFLMGFGLKAALVPFHSWLPDAHPAPAPVSAMLSGVLIKALGVYCLARIFYSVIGATPAVCSVLMFLGAASMLVGVFLAIGQWNLKRLLAYHSISQIGYIVLGIGLGTPLGIIGGLFHLFNHSVFKSLLFLNSGAIEYATGTRDLKEMGGLKDTMPTTFNTSLVASLSISGIPPFNGFWSKLIIVLAAVQSGHYVYGVFAILASLLTLSSFMKVQKFAFFVKPAGNRAAAREVPFLMRASMVMLALLCIAGGALIIPAVSKDFLIPAANVLLNATNYAHSMIGAVK